MSKSKDGTNVNIPALYNELNQQEQSEQYDRALKTSNKILQADKDDKVAFQCKLVCLIKLDKYTDVLKHISLNPELAEGLDFEKAYSEYRLNRTAESLSTLRNAANPDLRIKELLAQVLYRKEEYDEAFSIYKDIIKNSQDDYEEERSMNLSAVMAALQLWNSQEGEDLGLEEDSYELCFNAACGLIGQQRYEAALQKLKTAEVLCRALYEDEADTPPEEVDAELGDIRVQTGYVLQMLGRNDEALKCYNQVIKARPSDIGLTAVASNNIITLNKDQNVFDSQKRIKTIQADGLQQKLTRLQRQALLLNQSLFYLLQNKNELSRKCLEGLRTEQVDPDIPALVEAALLAKEKQHDKAVKCIQAEMARSPSLQLGLSLAQLYLSQGKPYKAADTLKDLDEDDDRKMGVVSSILMLYLSQEDYAGASEFLLDTIKWYKKNKPSSPELTRLMRANAKFQLKRDNSKGAAEMLEDLRKQNPGDMKTLAQLISAYSKFDPKKAQQVSRELPLPSDLSKVIDVDSLESSANLGPRYIKRATKGEMSPSAASPNSDDGLVQKKKKKNKKSKPPKIIDPSGIDHERWLPLRERTYYRGKRKKKGAIGKGSQGAVSAATAAEFDKSLPSPSASQPVVGDSAAAASPKAGGSGSTTPAAGAGPRTQKPQGAKQGRKKKKGGKW